jgi:heme/copper-type cytochrome/quinol oxidase subunit 2
MSAPLAIIRYALRMKQEKGTISMWFITLLFWGCALLGIAIVVAVLAWFIVVIRRSNKTVYTDIVEASQHLHPPSRM